MRALNVALVLCFFVAIVSAQYGFYGGYGGGYGSRFGQGYIGNGGIGIRQTGATIGNLYGLGGGYRGYGGSGGRRYFG